MKTAKIVSEISNLFISLAKIPKNINENAGCCFNHESVIFQSQSLSVFNLVKNKLSNREACLNQNVLSIYQSENQFQQKVAIIPVWESYTAFSFGKLLKIRKARIGYRTKRFPSTPRSNGKVFCGGRFPSRQAIGKFLSR